MKTNCELGTIVKVKSLNIGEGQIDRETSVMLLAHRDEVGIKHYFCQVLNESDCYVDVIHVDGKDLFLSSICLRVDLNRFRCMEDVAKYMGFSL